jgi:outer membrane lipoprotein-sorting protein
MRKRILLALAITAIARPDSLEDVLARMDSAAKEFKSYSANVKWLDYTKIINEKDETNGAMRLQRTKSGVSGIVDFSSAQDPYIVHVDGTKGQKYLPKANEIQDFNMRKFAGTLDQLLLLGFSVTREEMQRDYDIKLGGAEKVDSVGTTRIILAPKSAETLKMIRTIELWIQDGKGYPIQIKRTTAPSGNYQIFTFSNLQLNPPLPPTAFELPPSASRAKKIKEN